MTASSAVRSLLIVEDNTIAREGMGVVLRQAGYRASLVADGEEARDFLERNPPPDLILLDMLLPGRDGWSFLEDLKHEAALASVPIIIVTGLAIASPEWAKSLGASGLIRKPVDVPALLAEIGRCLCLP